MRNDPRTDTFPPRNHTGIMIVAKDSKDRAAKDAKKDTSISEDDKLDEALRESFPASDPPSATDPENHIGSSKRQTPRQNKI